MRIGITGCPPHQTPEEWAATLDGLGYRAATLPCDDATPSAVVDGYLDACRRHDLLVAEVGAWSNPMSLDPETRAAALSLCKRRLAFADRIGAACCANISGAVVGAGGRWDGGYPENYTAETYERLVATVREILDDVRPSRTFYTIEPMPWMVPDSPEAYARLLRDVDRPRFAVHLDIANWINCPARFFGYRAFVDECFALLGHAVKSIHLKDVALGPEMPSCLRECPPGTGGVDLRHYLRRASELPPDTPVLLEHLPDFPTYVATLQKISADGIFPLYTGGRVC